MPTDYNNKEKPISEISKYKVIVMVYDQLVPRPTKHSRGQDNIKMNKRNKTKQDWDSLNFLRGLSKQKHFINTYS